MQCSHLATAGCLVTLLGSAALSAQAPAPERRPAASEAAGQPLKPFSRLFEQHTSEAAAASRSKMEWNFTRPNSARRFICGMPVLPFDSAIDPKFEIRPREPMARFTMRIITPPCR